MLPKLPYPTNYLNKSNPEGYVPGWLAPFLLETALDQSMPVCCCCMSRLLLLQVLDS